MDALTGERKAVEVRRWRRVTGRQLYDYRDGRPAERNAPEESHRASDVILKAFKIAHKEQGRKGSCKVKENPLPLRHAEGVSFRPNHVRNAESETKYAY